MTGRQLATLVRGFDEHTNRLSLLSVELFLVELLGADFPVQIQH